LSARAGAAVARAVQEADQAALSLKGDQ
jgi:hypothetical protein